MCLEVQVGFIAEPELLVTCKLWRIGHGEDKKATSRVSAWLQILLAVIAASPFLKGTATQMSPATDALLALFFPSLSLCCF